MLQDTKLCFFRTFGERSCNMNHFYGILVLAFFSLDALSQGAFQGNESVSYEEAIARHSYLAGRYPTASLEVVGSTDIGKPLHLFVIDNSRSDEERESKCTLFINNGIHPGEPCGVDASIQLAERLLEGVGGMDRLLDSVVVAIVPIYNVGGALRRGCCVRANQNGPEAYGFRGNARNLDLNRDFIKADSRNARGFFMAFHRMKPHVIIDTHTSNGADYQYVMTMINTQPDKAGSAMGAYMRSKMNPSLYASMDARGFGMTPYVYTMGKLPESGLRDYLETPRYTTGYAALFNTIGYTSETHMLKPFAQRVESTYQFLLSTLEYIHAHCTELRELKAASDRQVANQTEFELDWELDTTSYRMIPFKGYEAVFPESEVHGQARLKYDRKQPFTKEIKYFDTYKPTKIVEAPLAYIIPQAWHEVIDRLAWNGVQMSRLESDTTVAVEAYYIDEFSASRRPYEGHFLKTAEALSMQLDSIAFMAGDVVVYCNQAANRYIVETLEPEGVDAFFRWSFFDSVLQQKEWYSDYVFEDTAAEMLRNDEALRLDFEAAKAADALLAESLRAQLYWIYKRSKHFEGSVNRYPVYRLPRR